MTVYFEVLKRDGPARLGKLMLERQIQTPGIISKDDYILVGSIFNFGPAEEAIADAAFPDQKKLVVMPYVPSALHFQPPMSLSEMKSSLPESLMGNDSEDKARPKGIVLHPFFLEQMEKADVYVICQAGCLKNPRDLVRAVVDIRNKTPSDTALYAPALATPANLAFLVYLGIDLIDTTRMASDAYFGRYHTRDGVRTISNTTMLDDLDIDELPCRCQHCQALRSLADGKDQKDGKKVSELLAAHNTLKLEEELAVVRGMIKSETIREYIERQVRVTPDLTAALRILDQEHEYLEARTPEYRRSILYANTAESLCRVEVTRFAERVLTRYSAPKSDVLLLLPCSARKPYSTSKSHKLFQMAIGSHRRFLHEVILTSPLALVPRELEEVYPAASYDIPVTGRWDLEERAWLLRCLDAYLENNKYSKIIAHIDGELRDVVEGYGIDAVYTGGGTNDASLARLAEAVSIACHGAVRLGDLRIQRYRAVADYYFGPGSGDALLAGKVKIKGREVQNERGKPLATTTPNGMIALSIEGARRLEPLGGYIVRIGDFLPKGSLLAPGVVDADDRIRPGDEVIIMGEKAFGVGRARMSGWEMVESTRGVAVELRRMEKA